MSMAEKINWRDIKGKIIIPAEELKNFPSDEKLREMLNRKQKEMIKNAEEDIKNCLTESFKAKDFTFPEMKIKGVIDLKAMF